MKIDHTLKPLTSGGVNGNRPRPDAGAPRAANAADDVRISPASAQLSQGGSNAPVDSARIAEIKAAISEGRFRINAEAIADGLIDTARDLLRSQLKA